MIRQILESDVIAQLRVLSLGPWSLFVRFGVDEARLWAVSPHFEMALLRVKGKPREIHWAGDFRFDWHRNIKSHVSLSDSGQSEACLVKDQTCILSALFHMSHVNFVSWRPEFVEKFCVQCVIRQRVGVINKDAVIFPKEEDREERMETKICVRHLKDSAVITCIIYIIYWLFSVNIRKTLSSYWPWILPQHKGRIPGLFYFQREVWSDHSLALNENPISALWPPINNFTLSSAIIHGFEYFTLKMAFKPWHTTPKHLLVLLDATSLGDINRSRRSIIWLQVGNLCDLQNNASVLWGVRYAKFWSIQYFIDIDILQNLIFFNLLIYVFCQILIEIKFVDISA